MRRPLRTGTPFCFNGTLALRVFLPDSLLVPTVGAVTPANPPNLLSKFGTAFGRRRVDHRDRCGCVHVGNLALHGPHGGQPLAQRLRALAGRVELRRSTSESCPRHHDSGLDVATAASPNQVERLAVLLVAVDVVNINALGRTAERANSRPSRSAVRRRSPKSQGAIGNGTRGLAPALAAFARGLG